METPALPRVLLPDSRDALSELVMWTLAKERDHRHDPLPNCTIVWIRSLERVRRAIGRVAPTCVPERRGVE